jgi:3-hydroxyisobutyrate dehydrogenase-like beta-hydroxyacid dehydrogenase
MARRVQGAGHDVCTMLHRNQSAADTLVEHGARVLATPADVARDSDVVITVLPADRELRETVLGPRGVIEGLAPGQALIDMTTATALTMQDVAERVTATGAEVLDAPVSGGTTAAASGSLTIMVGGDEAVLARHRALLQSMGTTILHVGAVGQGKVVKIVNQAMAAIHLLAIGEAFALGVGSGADASTLYDVIKASSGYSKMMDLRLPGFLLTGEASPGFRLDLMKKDVNLAVESARASNVALPLTAAAAQLFAAASAAGHGDDDFSSAAAFVAALSGVQLHA